MIVLVNIGLEDEREVDPEDKGKGSVHYVHLHRI